MSLQPYRKKEGALAESAFRQYMARFPSVVEILDLRGEKSAMWAEMDFQVRLRGRRITTWEVKHDKWIGVSGNFNYEAIRVQKSTRGNDSSCWTGWAAFSAASHFFVYNSETEIAHIIRNDDIQSALAEYASHHQPNARWINSSDGHWTMNILIPDDYWAHFSTTAEIGAEWEVENAMG